jgi:hypothetical protein
MHGYSHGGERYTKAFSEGHPRIDRTSKELKLVSVVQNQDGFELGGAADGGSVHGPRVRHLGGKCGVSWRSVR